jgi:hypothetical protein
MTHSLSRLTVLGSLKIWRCLIISLPTNVACLTTSVSLAMGLILSQDLLLSENMQVLLSTIDDINSLSTPQVLLE